MLAAARPLNAMNVLDWLSMGTLSPPSRCLPPAPSSLGAVRVRCPDGREMPRPVGGLATILLADAAFR
jgi:hypothetical protein